MEKQTEQINIIQTPFLEKFIRCQEQIKHAQMGGENNHFDSKYATLENVIDAIKPIANANGLGIAQLTGKDEIGHYLNTIVFDSQNSENLSAKTYLVLDKQNMQGYGSALTYARRYGLAGVFCLAQKDDDANEATRQSNEAEQKRTKTQTRGVINGNTKKSIDI